MVFTEACLTHENLQKRGIVLTSKCFRTAKLPPNLAALHGYDWFGVGHVKDNRGLVEVLIQKGSQEEKATMVEYYASVHMVEYLE